MLLRFGLRERKTIPTSKFVRRTHIRLSVFFRSEV